MHGSVRVAYLAGACEPRVLPSDGGFRTLLDACPTSTGDTCRADVVMGAKSL